jgi:hypothetical protein
MCGSTRHVKHAKHIGLELALDHLLRRALERAKQAVAGVVDEHIDLPEALHRLGHGSVDRVLVRHIQRERGDLARAVVEMGAGGVAQRRGYVPALRGKVLHCRRAYA